MKPLSNTTFMQVRGKGNDEGSVNFLPPGVKMSNKYAKNKQYFQNIRDVIERVLERPDSVDPKSAGAYPEFLNNIFDQFKVRRVVSPHQHDTRKKQINVDWKNERRHFMKASSRVGQEYQVDVLPPSGLYVASSSADKNENLLYDQIWDSDAAEKSGKVDFVHTRVKHNKKEKALIAFHSRGYRLPGFYEEVCKMTPTDGSVWTEEEKYQFKTAIFREHKDMSKVSKAMNKPVTECMTYYLGSFKQSDEYQTLKSVMRKYAGNFCKGILSVPVFCDGCGKGGKLIVCDICESHYHLSCTSPPLASIPEGLWSCAVCTSLENTEQKIQQMSSMVSGNDTCSKIEGSLGAAESSLDQSSKVKSI
mmetsp:Transcript_7611/g.16307  ORF Transcript_7611/g.16307 Transcript_7611/m.16307 type:complete len:362 (-) Transcript_7611:2-1087(-)